MSKAKRNGGYYLADLSGVVLDPATVGQEQELTHKVVDDIKEAIAHNKPILCSNLRAKAGTNTFDLSPTASSVFSPNSNQVLAMFGGYSIVIEKDGDTEYAIVIGVLN